jgi:polysaccharide chain length determinant protein (PEP-CTERM system associated)
MDTEQGIQIGDLLDIIRRRAAVTGVVAGAVLLASIVVAAVLPNRFEAWTTVLVEPQTISKRLVEAGLEESDLNSRLHLMTMQILSRGRLSRIIDDLGLYVDDSKEMTREEVIEMMRDDIRVEPVLPELEQGLRRNQAIEINTFRLFYQSESPEMAANVANRLANDFIEEHIKERVQISGDTSEFIDSQREALTSQIAAVENRIAAVKAANAGRLPEDLASNQRILERATDSLRVVQRDLAVAESDESFYRQQALLGGEIPSFNNQASPSYRLQLLELQLNEYLSRGFTEKHPDVVNAREEIRALRAQVETGNAADAEARSLSPAQQNAQAEAQRAALRAASARKEIARLSDQIAEIEARIAETPRVAEQLGALEREYDHLYGSYQEFSGKGLEAGVAAGMERRQKGEQFRVLETAYPPPEATSPNRPLIAALGLMLGLALGCAAAVLLEASDTSFHEARALQGAVRVPVLASIPAIWLESDRAALRRRRILQAAAAAAIAGLVLAGAVAGNWYVNGLPGPIQSLLRGNGAETAAVDRVG